VSTKKTKTFARRCGGDHGPRDESRIIEISHAAAQAIGFHPGDEMKVKVEPILPSG
jgi:rare lipoprotein A (peptidoglycan hydrolase)